jgi:hypothetical protein
LIFINNFSVKEKHRVAALRISEISAVLASGARRAKGGNRTAGSADGDLVRIVFLPWVCTKDGAGGAV